MVSWHSRSFYVFLHLFADEPMTGSSSLVETMAYILLAHLSQPEVTTSDITKLSPILRQFNQRCNSFGGFYSTQVTTPLPQNVWGERQKGRETLSNWRIAGELSLRDWGVAVELSLRDWGVIP